MKKLIPVLVILLVLAGGWYWWHQRQSGDDGPLVLYGNVDIRQVALAFEGSGRVAEMRVEEGDSVVKGQVLARLDTDTLQLQVDAQEAAVEAQRQALLKLRNGSRPEEVAQARAQLDSAEASAVLADQELARATQLRASRSGAASQQSVDQARAQADAAKASVAQARAALDLVEAGSRAEDIAQAEAQLRGAEAELSLLRRGVEDGELSSPDNAVIRSRLREPGDMVTASTPVYALALTQPKWVRVYVSEPDLGHVRPGLAAEVFADSFPDQPTAGKVGYISSVAEFTPKSVQTEELRTSLVYEVHVTIDDPNDRLRLGQPVTVRLQDVATP
ncbi:HlyD family efflux transporter periplasmic adaptor subunit [Paracoccus aurantiacus]|uniref:HlyD family efflux transporter periplasmic adaptor subunit n=1 Tax=Paracoccus aurantiacus TaxID=2599412 RepID=A0A5C6S4E1_9RHOB|nr:HlyD family efflux transporter periplasmic adaptor subunit [Paracoccus aurantiacus]TXB68443.1 HlyD family efflux transporter periplasmic adaptor subunit [Paracoccus aurantiacus]